jgi:hypothetical protein
MLNPLLKSCWNRIVEVSSKMVNEV